MASHIDPCHEDEFFLEAIEEFDVTSARETKCTICLDPFESSKSDKQMQPADESLSESSTFPGRYGHDLPAHRAVRLVKCAHIFGAECIARWLLDDKNTTCPLCRQQIIYNDSQEFDTPIVPTEDPALAQAREDERRRNREYVEAQSIEDMVNWDLSVPEGEQFTILPSDHDIVLYVSLVMFTGTRNDTIREILHIHLQDMITASEPNIDWIVQMQEVIAPYDEKQPFLPSNHFENTFRLLRTTLSNNIQSHANPETIFHSLWDRMKNSVQEHAANFPSDVPAENFIENVEKAIHYFTAWLMINGRINSSTTVENSDENGHHFRCTSARGLWPSQRVFMGFQIIDWAEHERKDEGEGSGPGSSEDFEETG